MSARTISPDLPCETPKGQNAVCPTCLRITAFVIGLLFIVSGILILKLVPGIGALTGGSILIATGALISGISVIIMLCINKTCINSHNPNTNTKDIPESGTTQSNIESNNSDAKDDNLIVCGSSDPDHARVFCFAEKHEKPAFRKEIAEFIQKHYSPGDIILVEGVKSGEVISAKKHQQTSFLPDGYIVEGWEPHNFEELNHNFFKKNDEMYNRLLALQKQLKQKLPPKNYEKKDLYELKKFLPQFIKEYNQLAEYYYVSTKNVKKAINDLFKRLEKKTLGTDNVKVFYVVVLKLLQKLEKNQSKPLYKNITSEQAAELIANAPIRNESLCHSMEKVLSSGKKVFVIGGLAHFFQAPFSKPEHVAGIKKYLSKYPSVIVTQKKWYQNLKLAQLNPDLPILAR